jgi:hypothetical protein
MPVTFTALGDTLKVSIFDDNFETLQDLIRCGLVAADFANTFNRYHILRYTGGRVTSSTSFAKPLLVNGMSTLNGVLDVTYRCGTTFDPPMIDSTANDWRNIAMELLGKPGPSLYYQWQEDGLTSAGIPGWPPAYWPINRFSDDLCFSFWLTIPGASQKVYVKEPCVARVRGSAKGSLNFHQLYWFTHGYTAAEDLERVVNKREFHMSRVGLFVDTNPVLGTDFINSNPNLIGSNGAMAPYVSWKKIREKTYYTSQRTLMKLTGEVPLLGGRDYNFSFKYRDGGIKGFTENNSTVWNPGHWRYNLAFPTDMNLDSRWITVYNNTANQASQPPIGGGGFIPEIQHPNLLSLWENAAVTVEFYYGRETAYIDDSSNAEFDNVP